MKRIAALILGGYTTLVATGSTWAPETIPAIFREMMKSETLDSRVALDAIKTVTGEDFETRLKTYGTKATEHFEGLAISHYIVGPYERNEEGK